MKENLPIDLIAVLTIERAKRRHDSFLGAAMHPLINVPVDILKFFIGIDGADYEDMQAVADAAKADGFAWVEDYAIGTVTEYVQQTRASVAQIWGYARILRYLVETKQTGLILWDDKMLSVPFSFFCDVLSELQATDKIFYMWQLSLRGHIDEIGLEAPDLQTQIQQNAAIFQSLTIGAAVSPFDFLIGEGIAGYEESIVYSPQGANWMLNELAKGEDFYTFLDHFICKQVSKRAATAVENGKGFYRPMAIGYNFVETHRPMGTFTNWAPEGSFHFQESQTNIEPTYIRLPTQRS